VSSPDAPRLTLNPNPIDLYCLPAFGQYDGSLWPLVTGGANDMGLAIVRPRRDLDVMRAKNAGIEISFRRLENQFFSGSGTRHSAQAEYDPNRASALGS
jgi:hypothetical protein